MTEPIPIPGKSLVWAMTQVLGEPEDDDGTTAADVNARFDQAEADALAAGCPPDVARVMGMAVASYQSTLDMLAEFMTMELVEAANAERTTPAYERVLASLDNQLRVFAESLDRDPVTVDVDLADVTDRAHRQLDRIMLLAIAHRDRS